MKDGMPPMWSTWAWVTKTRSSGGSAERVERDGAGGGLVAGVEEDGRVAGPDEPGVHALFAEGQVEPVDEWQGERLGQIVIMLCEGVRIQAEHRSQAAGGFRGEVPT